MLQEKVARTVEKTSKKSGTKLRQLNKKVLLIIWSLTGRGINGINVSFFFSLELERYLKLFISKRSIQTRRKMFRRFTARYFRFIRRDLCAIP